MKQLPFIAIIIIVAAFTVNAQTSAFSYQGTLAEGGVPANGSFEMQFKLFDSLGGPTQIGSTLTRNPVAVTNGGFAVVLDFGSSAFPGPDRFLEIAVRNLSAPPPPVLTTLSPRSQLLSSPYAIRSKTVTGPVTGTSPTATLTVTNDQPGITDPSPLNIPPAALKGEATSTSDSNIGVLGVGNGSTGIGVLGVTNGSGSGGQANAVGVLALSTSATGETIGLSAQVMSPTGTAIEAETVTGGFIFKGRSNDPSSSNPKFSITAAGQVLANAGVFAKGFHLNSGLFDVLENGNMGVAHIDAGTVATTGNVTVGGTLNAANVNIGGGAITAASVTTTGDVNVGGTLQANSINAPGGTLQLGGSNVSMSGTLQTNFINAPSGTLLLGSTGIQTTGNSNFGTVNLALPSGGISHICVDGTGPNILRVCSSSLRYKKQVHPFTGGLDIVNRLHPISFLWKANNAIGLGLGAEDVAKVEPRLTFNNSKGEIEGVRYDQLNVVLINAIKQQQEQIDRQQTQIDALTKLVRRYHSKATTRKAK